MELSRRDFLKLGAAGLLDLATRSIMPGPPVEAKQSGAESRNEGKLVYFEEVFGASRRHEYRYGGVGSKNWYQELIMYPDDRYFLGRLDAGYGNDTADGFATSKVKETSRSVMLMPFSLFDVYEGTELVPSMFTSGINSSGQVEFEAGAVNDENAKRAVISKAIKLSRYEPVDTRNIELDRKTVGIELSRGTNLERWKSELLSLSKNLSSEVDMWLVKASDGMVELPPSSILQALLDAYPARISIDILDAVAIKPHVTKGLSIEKRFASREVLKSFGGLVVKDGKARFLRGGAYFANCLLSKETGDRQVMTTAVAFNAAEWQSKWLNTVIRNRETGDRPFKDQEFQATVYVLHDNMKPSEFSIWFGKDANFGQMVEKIFSIYPNGSVFVVDQNMLDVAEVYGSDQKFLGSYGPRAYPTLPEEIYAILNPQFHRNAHFLLAAVGRK